MRVECRVDPSAPSEGFLPEATSGGKEAQINNFTCAGRDLFVAVALNNYERVSENVQANPLSVHARNRERKTPFHCAIESGHLEIAALLLQHGAEINPRTPTGTTPLHWAAGKGRAETVRFLIEHGADASAKDLWKVTPRERALRMGHRAVARLLSPQPPGIAPRPSPPDDSNLWLIRTRQR